MKKFCLTITTVLLLLSLCVKNALAISFELEVTGDKTIEINRDAQLKATFITSNDLIDENNPSSIGKVNGEDVTKKATWKSSDSKIVEVSKNGVVTGKKAGKATITAEYTDGELTRNAEFEVTVIKGNSNIEFFGGVAIGMSASILVCALVTKCKKKK